MLVARSLSYFTYSGYDEKLDKLKYYSLGTFAVALLIGLAAFSILRPPRSPAIGFAALAGLVPVMAGEFATAGAALAYGVSQKDAAPGAGWILLQVGFALLVVAGIGAAFQLRRRLSVPSDRLSNLSDARALAPVALALIVGAVAALGWAKWLDVTGTGGSAWPGPRRPWSLGCWR